MKNFILPLYISIFFLLCLVTPIFGGKCLQCYKPETCADNSSVIDCASIDEAFAFPDDIGDIGATLDPIKPAATATDCITILNKDKPELEVRMCGIPDACTTLTGAAADLQCTSCVATDEGPCNVPEKKAEEAGSSDGESVSLDLTIFFFTLSTALVKFVF